MFKIHFAQWSMLNYVYRLSSFSQTTQCVSSMNEITDDGRY
jgi:hypothetical protein